METLRQEILQAQSIRSDLLKWKLALVGGLGAAGLGFAGSETLRHADLVLCAIPPVCVYVDLLCRHLSLRILVLGGFMRGAALDEPTVRAYEVHAERARNLPSERGRSRSAFDLEDWALELSTYALSVALVVYGLVMWWRFSIPFVASGVVGLAATFAGHRHYRDRCAGLRGLGAAG